MAAHERLITHAVAVGQGRADSVVGIELSQWGLAGVEKLPARHVGGDMYELCSVPFFSYGFRLGDIVEVDGDDDSARLVRKVVRPSNRLNIRIVVTQERETDAAMRRIIGILNQAGCVFEVWKPGYLAADVPSSEAERIVLSGLSALREHGVVSIERV
jgi:Domain of unknown function (DUF4265)